MLTLEIKNPGFAPIRLSRQIRDASGDWAPAAPFAVVDSLGKVAVPLVPGCRVILETPSVDDVVVGIENSADQHTLKLSAQKLAKGGFKAEDPERIGFVHPKRQNFMTEPLPSSANLPINANRRGFVEVLAS